MNLSDLLIYGDIFSSGSSGGGESGGNSVTPVAVWHSFFANSYESALLDGMTIYKISNTVPEYDQLFISTLFQLQTSDSVAKSGGGVLIIDSVIDADIPGMILIAYGNWIILVLNEEGVATMEADGITGLSPGIWMGNEDWSSIFAAGLMWIPDGMEVSS